MLTGSLDGQIQVWDTRTCTSKTPAALKLSVSTPFTIRRIQWAPMKTDKIYQLAVQCDRSIRIYDIRRIDTKPLPSTDLEHPQRILSMDWTSETRSILSLSVDQILRIHSSNGNLIADAQMTNLSPQFVSNKVKLIEFQSLKTAYCLFLFTFRFDQRVVIIFSFQQRVITKRQRLVLSVGDGTMIIEFVH